MREKALIAMSGGVDSSVAAWLMLERGFDCVGATMKLFSTGDSEAAGEGRPDSARHPHRGCSTGTTSHRGCCSLADVNDAREVAFRLGMPHYVLNFTEAFRDEVIRRFIETYERGATPNPCIDCNRYLKFACLRQRGRELAIDTLVTGHYARIERDNGGRYLLRKALDPKKDQSYVLYTMTQEQLAHTVFPLGDKTKQEVREIAAERGFGNAAKQDSQDICFVPDGDYGAFIETYTGKTYPPGDIIGTDGAVLGRHRGLIRYTLGQRRGLGLSFPEPMYVAAKSIPDNTLTLGPEGSLYSQTLEAEDLNLIAWDTLPRPLRLRVKTRYLQTEQWATVEQTEADRVRIDFEAPQRAITPGQAAVFYDGEVVVGGGRIVV
jgi:tRNA-specific 2-thiouridylase